MTAKHFVRRTLFTGTIMALTVVAVAWLTYWYRQNDAAASAAPAALPEVVVSQPLLREVDPRLGFLGQFSPVKQVELRAQVGGTLTEIHFKDGDIVQKDDLLFTIDPRPYEIRLAQVNAQLETATARLARIIHHLLIFCGGCSAKWPIHIANRCLVELLRATVERHSRHDRRYSASL